MERGIDAQKLVWEGAIPLQVHLHESEVTTLPPPPPVMILAPRIGYLPLLSSQLKPLFSSALPPGTDTIWFDYKGLPLKWYIPTGALFDLLCPEPERPWNLTVHFRGYPTNILIPCESEDAVKWSFINSLKEAAYIINGNCKSVMNMSQSDQTDLWKSICDGNLEAFIRVSNKLRLGVVEDEYMMKLWPPLKSRSSSGSTDNAGGSKTGRIPIRLCLRMLDQEFDDMEDVSEIDSWEGISYINRPVEIHKDEGKCFTLRDALRSLLPEYLEDKLSENIDKGSNQEIGETAQPGDSGYTGKDEEKGSDVSDPSKCFKIKLLRIQGIEPNLDIPFSWVVNNLMNPDHFVHICLYIKGSL